MGFFTAPTKQEVAEALAPFLDGDRNVHAYVIGQAMGGRVGIVATESAVYVIKIALFKLKGQGQVARFPLGMVGVSRGGLTLSVDRFSVKLGLADSSRAAELQSYVGATG